MFQIEKNFSSIILKLFLIVLFIGVSQQKSFGQFDKILDNADSLEKYLKMESHPQFSEAKVIALYKVITQTANKNYIQSIVFDVAYKVFDIKAAESLLDVVIPKLNNGVSVKMLSAITYNWKNDKLVTDEVTNKDLEESKYTKGVKLRKFSMPGVVNGSIIRFKYEIKYAKQMTLFEIEDEFPIIYNKIINSQYFYNYTYQTNYASKYEEFESESALESSHVPAGVVNLKTKNSQTLIFLRRNVDADVTERFQSKKTSEYIRLIDEKKGNDKFPGKKEDSTKTWQDIAKEIYFTYCAPAFAKHVILDSIISKEKLHDLDTLARAKKIFEYVQKEYRYIDGNRASFEKIYELKGGNARELNLFLCALFRHAGISSDMLYISNDKLRPANQDTVDFSVLKRLAVRVVIGNQMYFCEAEQNYLPFGYLPFNYYNGFTLVVNKVGGGIFLSPELAKDISKTNVSLVKDEKLNSAFKFKYEKTFGIYTSSGQREDITDTIQTSNDYKKWVEKLLNHANFSNYTFNVEHLKDITKSVKITVTADVEFDQNEALIILDPYLQKVYNGENPFLNMESRKSEIEFDYCHLREYNFLIDVSNSNYSIEEIPSPKRIQYGDPKLIGFNQKTYLDKAKNKVKISYVFENNPQFYAPEELEDLKKFFGDLVNTFTQKVILKSK